MGTLPPRRPRHLGKPTSHNGISDMTAPGPVSMTPGSAYPSRRICSSAGCAMLTFWCPPTGKAYCASRCVGFLPYLRQMRGTKHDGICRDLVPCLNCLSLNGSDNTEVHCVGVSPRLMYTSTTEKIVRQRGKRRLCSSEDIAKGSCESSCVSKRPDLDLDGSESNRTTPRQTQNGGWNAPP